MLLSSLMYDLFWKLYNLTEYVIQITAEVELGNYGSPWSLPCLCLAGFFQPGLSL